MGEAIDIGAAQQAGAARKSETDSTHHDMHCPKCKNENTQSIELIIKAGTQNISTTTSTAGVGVSLSGGIGIGGASSSTKGQSVSELAKELPTKFHPAHGESDWFFVLPLIASGLPGLYFESWWVFGIIFIALLIYLVPRKLIPAQKRDKQRLELYQRWITKGFFCHRCGNTFIPGSNEVYVPIESKT